MASGAASPRDCTDAEEGARLEVNHAIGVEKLKRPRAADKCVEVYIERNDCRTGERPSDKTRLATKWSATERSRWYVNSISSPDTTP